MGYPVYRGSPPCTIFLTSSEQRNIVQLCSRCTPPFLTGQIPKVVFDCLLIFRLARMLCLIIDYKWQGSLFISEMIVTRKTTWDCARFRWCDDDLLVFLFLFLFGLLMIIIVFFFPFLLGLIMIILVIRFILSAEHLKSIAHPIYCMSKQVD